MNENVNKNVLNNFLVDSDETGRHVVFSPRTGKRYFIEAIGNGRTADWGSFNPSTGNIENKKGHGKYTGSIKPEESLITSDNGFKNIQIIEGGSPYYAIEQLDSKYPSLAK